MRLVCVFIVGLMLGLLLSCARIEPVKVYQLTTSYLEKPLGVDGSSPVLGWKIQTKDNGFTQIAYQVLVATSPELLNEKQANAWNSGRVPSDHSTNIVYSGIPLVSSQRYFWMVKVWGSIDTSAMISNTAWWETGLLAESDWQAKWIAAVAKSDSVPPVLPAPYFRREFTLDKNVRSARLYISGLGYHEAFINGQKVGDHVLDPMLTRYDKRVLYLTHDITSLLKKGRNALGVVLGNGWYNQHTREAWDFDKARWRDSPALLCLLKLELIDGSTLVVSSDSTWVHSTGPIVFNGVHNGETYDARLEIGGWDRPGYDDKDWKPVHVVDGPKGMLHPQVMPPIRFVKTIVPARTWKTNKPGLMVDLGQNITGWARIKVKGNAGDTVTLRYGERIHDDGSLDQKELSRFIWTGETQTGHYILKGGKEEAWNPVFTYHGFKYIEVTFSSPGTELVSIEGQVVHTDLARRGSFRCSNEMFNKVHENLGWSFLGNYHGYPTDCPHREKMGWTGDALLVAEAGLFNFNIEAAYLKWLNDFVDEQQANGQLPGIIPTSGWGYKHGRDEYRDLGYGPQWEGAFLEIPWQIYLHTGDSSIIKRYYKQFKSYVDFLHDVSVEYLMLHGIDDHKQLENLTKGPFLSTAFFYRFSDMLSRMAAVSGEMDDAGRYMDLAGRIKSAFNNRYFDDREGVYYHGGQTPMALALYFDLVEDGERNRVLGNLLKEIERKNGHIDAGVVGTKAVINSLLMHDQHRVLFDLANKREFPGWGYWVDSLGATTLFQNWDGSQSRNHIMFGSIGDYFYKGLAGIQVDENNPGYKHFVIHPSVDNDIEWVEASLDSPRGLIKSSWKKEGGTIVLEITIPANAVATVHVPTSRVESVSLNGKLLDSSHKAFSSAVDNHVICRVGSGKYRFVADWK